MSDRSTTVTDPHERFAVGGPREGNPITNTYDAWQRSSARLLELERSLATHRCLDPGVEALINEVKVLRSCTVELFVLVSGSFPKGSGSRSAPGANASTFGKASAKARASSGHPDPSSHRC